MFTKNALILSAVRRGPRRCGPGPDGIGTSTVSRGRLNIATCLVDRVDRDRDQRVGVVAAALLVGADQQDVEALLAVPRRDRDLRDLACRCGGSGVGEARSRSALGSDVDADGSGESDGSSSHVLVASSPMKMQPLVSASSASMS